MDLIPWLWKLTRFNILTTGCRDILAQYGTFVCSLRQLKSKKCERCMPLDIFGVEL